MSLLKLEHINTGYGKKQVLFDVNLEVQEGETVLLVGANGSGKSTLLKAIFRLLPLWKNEANKQSSIWFNDQSITTTSSEELIRQGIIYIPQKNEHFEHMSIKENLLMCILHSKTNMKNKNIERVLEEMPTLSDRSNQKVTSLSGGERKLLSFGKIALNEPKLVLYDEPLAGVSATNSTVLINNILNLRKSGTTTIIVEHRITELVEIVDRVIGLKLGKLTNKELNTLSEIKQFMI